MLEEFYVEKCLMQKKSFYFNIIQQLHYILYYNIIPVNLGLTFLQFFDLKFGLGYFSEKLRKMR